MSIYARSLVALSVLVSLKMFHCLMVILPDVYLPNDLRGLSPIAHAGLMFHQEKGFSENAT